MNKENIFSRGGIPSKKAKSNYFTGKVIAKDISAKIKPKNEKIYHVTFKSGAKTKLHFHNGGQTLIVTKGRGGLSLYRRFGTNETNFKIRKTKSISLRIGDCVYIPAKTLHTHGTVTKKTDFAHIAINSFPKNNVEPKTFWYESDFQKNVIKRLK
ncbi:MAG: cupin [Candidatus Nitrosopelagicus sp.]|jgi:quercetin dioxygenase-like cupin family protein|nr:cupin [Candidatus Nitrosopelagicus sp.]|tara:strand:- start:200 stop:664 length:465 start_codon:yes stop_codon:yes gene_type:complete